MGLSRLVPPWLQPAARTLAARLILPSAKPTVAPPSGGLATIAGLLSSPSGIGEGSRLFAERLATVGYEVGLIDVTSVTRQQGGVPFAHPHVRSDDIGGPLLVHLNPPSFQVVLARHLRRHVTGRKVIGNWTWEAPDIPHEWRAAFRLVHEVWVPSRFVAEALGRAGCEVPLRVVPYPLRLSVTPPPPASQSLTVLTILAFDSGFERKNPVAAVDAFRLAFGSSSDATLVLKTRGRSATGDPEARLRAAIAESPNIRHVHGDLAPEEYRRLLASADVLLSLHRAEGFGIPCAEMMLLGKPVVATAWSGNLDFMSEESACLVPAQLVPLADGADAYKGLRSVWADPCVADAADWLRRLRDPALRATIGRAARTHAAACLSHGAFARAVAPGLGEVAASRRSACDQAL